MMASVNPQVVKTLDGRVGTLVARHNLTGCVEFGKRRILEPHALISLEFHLTDTKPYKDPKY